VRGALNVRAKLLLMLAVLSLPLLIVGLYQLRVYRASLNDQAEEIARVEAEAEVGALESWLEYHPAQAAAPQKILQSDADDLYAHLALRSTPGAVVVFDPQGRAIAAPRASFSTTTPEELTTQVRQLNWNDGASRMTAVARARQPGWSVAVGVPAPEGTLAGRSILLIAAAWAVTLTASCLLAVWAVGRFTKPLRRLATSASSLGEGNLGERARVETDDEVGSLARSFNAMAGSLESKFEAVARQSAFIGEVLDSLPLGVVVLDAKLVVRKVNSAFARTVGRAASDLTGQGLYEAAAGLAVLSEVIEGVRRSRSAYVSYGSPLRLSSREGEGFDGGEAQKFWDVTVWPVMEQTDGRGDLILILSEVSKRVRAERLATSAFAAEKARAAELASVIEQMVEGVVIVDADGR